MQYLYFYYKRKMSPLLLIKIIDIAKILKEFNLIHNNKI